MRQHSYHHHGQEHAKRRQQADWHYPAPHLVEVERERGFEHQARHEGQKDDVRAQRGKPDAGNQTNQDAADGQEHRVRNRRRCARDQAQHGGGATQDDQE